MEQIKQKRVCVFTLHPSKDVRILNRQCRSFQRNGWDVTLIARADTVLNPDSKEGIYDDEGIKVIGIKKWASSWGRIKTVCSITHLASKQKTDIYHFHDPDFLIPAIFLKWFTRKPVIYDIHEYFEITIPEKLPNIWPLRKITGGIIWFFEIVFGKLIGNISAVCEDHYKAFLKVGCNAIYTPNYASIQDFVPIEISDEEWTLRHKKVIFIGTLGPSRGSLVLLDIAKEVKAIRPEIKFLITRRFHTKSQEDAFMSKLALPDYENVIKFIPNVNGKELPKAIRQAGIALNVDAGFSLYQETVIGIVSLPTKIFEYMSQALPIVSYDLPHSRKYIAGESCGFLVKADSPKEYADAIIKLVDNIELAKEMGRRGQEHC